MNDQAILLGYIAFSVIKKLIPKASLIQLFPQTPFVSLFVDLPFPLDETFQTVIKEELKKTLKDGQYKVLEMVPQVAFSYARSKKVKIDLDENQSIVSLLETPYELIWMQEECIQKELDPKISFEILTVSKSKESLIVIGFGESLKEAKKSFKEHYSTKTLNYLNDAGYLTPEGVLSLRGQDLTSYYQNFFIKAFFENGVKNFELDLGENFDTAYQYLDESFSDPLISVNQFFENPVIYLKTSFSLEKLNSYLKSVAKIPKMLGFSYEIDLEGRFQQSELQKLSFETKPSLFGEKEGKKLAISLLDPFGRKLPLVSVNIMKKTMELKAYIFTLPIVSLLKDGLCYPRLLDRPRQVAFSSSLLNEEKAEMFLVKRLQGCSCFVLDGQKASRAGTYQVDEWVN